MASWPTIADVSGNGYDGTATNMEQADITADAPGGAFSRRSMIFDGVNEYVTMGNVLGFEYTDTFSVSAWFKMSGAGDDVVVSKQDGTTTYRGWGLFLNSGQINWQLNNDVGSSLRTQIKTTDTFNDGNWHHVVATYSASTPGAAADMDLYVDGVNVATSVVSDTLGTNTISNTSSLNLGARTDGADGHFAGDIDEVAVYDKELSLAEAQWIYNGGYPRDLADVAAPSNLVAWWRMGEQPLVALPIVPAEALSQDVFGMSPALTIGGGPAVITKYKMRGRDDGVPAPGYVTWVVTGSPDFAGAGFSGGTPTPVGSMIPGSAVVEDQWEQ